MSEQQWSEHISKREGQQITADALFRHSVKAHQDKRIGKKDRVIKERLRQHQHKTEKRSPPMFVHDRVPNLPPRRVRSRANPCAVAAVYDRRTSNRSLD